MTTKKGKRISLYLGDEEFLRKISIYYSWFTPVVLFLFSFVLFFDKAFITGLIVLFLSLFNLPTSKKYTDRLPVLVRVTSNVGLIALIFFSMNLYI